MSKPLLGVILGGVLGLLDGLSAWFSPEASRVGTMVAVLFATVTLSSLAPSSAQTLDQKDSFTVLSALVGRWEGTTEGQPGKGTVTREYERILGARFIQVRNRSVYPPQGTRPKGEVHEDIGVFSFDSARKRVVFRQFHIEGFVNQYVLDPASTPRRLILTTEAIENIPAGWRARETYELIGADELEEIFELAEPGKEFAVYSRNRLRRQQ